MPSKLKVHQITNIVKPFLQKRCFDITRYERLKYPRTYDLKIYVADNETDKEIAAHFISDNFLRNDPLHIAYKVEVNKESLKVLKDLWLEEMQFNMTIIAKLSLDQSICGVCINHYFDKVRETKILEKFSEQAKLLKLDRLSELFKARYEITKRGKIQNSKKICEIGGIAVNKSFSNNLRLDERLIRESILLAKLSGCEKVICECTGFNFRQLLARLGFCISWQELIKNLPGSLEHKKEEFLERAVSIYNKNTDWHKPFDE